MPSSKFNRHPTPRLRPPTCYPPAGSCWPLYPNEFPPRLNAWGTWYDLDPLDPIWGSGCASLKSAAPGLGWSGWSAPDVSIIQFHVLPSLELLRWNCHMTLYYHFHAPAHHCFEKVWVDPRFPFDTGLLQDVVIVGADFRGLRIMA